MLYWTDWSIISPAIYRSPVINPARETLVTGNLTWPTALAIDFTGNQSRGAGCLRLRGKRCAVGSALGYRIVWLWGRLPPPMYQLNQKNPPYDFCRG